MIFLFAFFLSVHTLPGRTSNTLETIDGAVSEDEEVFIFSFQLLMFYKIAFLCLCEEAVNKTSLGPYKTYFHRKSALNVPSLRKNQRIALRKRRLLVLIFG